MVFRRRKSFWPVFPRVAPWPCTSGSGTRRSWLVSWPLSAYLLFPEQLQKEFSKANADTPVFIGHGTQDPVVPFMLGQAVRSALAGRTMAG